MERPIPPGGCCKRIRVIKSQNDRLKLLLRIAVRALKTYEMEANSVVAEDALARIRRLSANGDIDESKGDE